MVDGVGGEEGRRAIKSHVCQGMRMRYKLRLRSGGKTVRGGRNNLVYHDVLGGRGRGLHCNDINKSERDCGGPSRRWALVSWRYCLSLILL